MKGCEHKQNERCGVDRDGKEKRDEQLSSMIIREVK
jgi:hypothetical protein